MPTPSRILAGVLHFVVLYLAIVGANTLAERYVVHEWARLALTVACVLCAPLLWILERSAKPLGDDSVLHLNR
jgi:hypothetical protein